MTSPLICIRFSGLVIHFADENLTLFNQKSAMPYLSWIYLLDDPIQRTHYKETEHYQLTKNFLESPELYFRHLFEDY